jgi:hypothetical protein
MQKRKQCSLVLDVEEEKRTEQVVPFDIKEQYICKYLLKKQNNGGVI